MGASTREMTASLPGRVYQYGSTVPHDVTTGASLASVMVTVMVVVVEAALLSVTAAVTVKVVAPPSKSNTVAPDTVTSPVVASTSNASVGDCAVMENVSGSPDKSSSSSAAVNVTTGVPTPAVSGMLNVSGPALVNSGRSFVSNTVTVCCVTTVAAAPTPSGPPPSVHAT